MKDENHPASSVRCDKRLLSHCVHNMIVATSYHTWLCGNSLIGLSLKMNGTGINRNRATSRIQPVTTPIASGLLKKKMMQNIFKIKSSTQCFFINKFLCEHTFSAGWVCTYHCRINWLIWTCLLSPVLNASLFGMHIMKSHNLSPMKHSFLLPRFTYKFERKSTINIQILFSSSIQWHMRSFSRIVISRCRSKR